MDGSKLKAILPGVPDVESPFFEEIMDTRGFDAETRRIATDLHEHGYAVLRFPDDELEARAERIKRGLAPHFDFDTWRATGWARNEGLRLMDAWTFDTDVRAIACNRRIMEILTDIFGRRAWPFQTLNFPVSTQQHFHSDSVHFSSIPEKFMCGVWVALEDVTEDAGPLVYYPGTHKWPIVYNEQIGVRITGNNVGISQGLYEQVWSALVEKFQIAPKYFCPKKGEALIWLANLLHGGGRQLNPSLSRWSQVTHYFFENCCYLTPMLSDVPIGKLFLRDPVDISMGTHMPNIYVDLRLAEVGGLPADFDGERYLQINPDVRAANVDPVQHYLHHGIHERRTYR